MFFYTIINVNYQHPCIHLYNSATLEQTMTCKYFNAQMQIFKEKNCIFIKVVEMKSGVAL